MMLSTVHKGADFLNTECINAKITEDHSNECSKNTVMEVNTIFAKVNGTVSSVSVSTR